MVVNDVTSYIGTTVSVETLIALNNRCESFGWILHADPATGGEWHITKLQAFPPKELEQLSGIYPGAPGSIDTSNRETELIKGKTSMANVSQMAESPWLKGEDLKNRTVTVTIAGASVEPMKQADGKTENKVVVSFVGKQKKLICNITQVRALIQATGNEDTDFWPGKLVMLSPGVSSNGKPTIVVLPPPTAEGFVSAPVAVQPVAVAQPAPAPVPSLVQYASSTPMDDNPFN